MCRNCWPNGKWSRPWKYYHRVAHHSLFLSKKKAKENYTGQHNPRFASVHFDADVSGRASFHLGYELGISEFICLAEMQTVQISQCNIFEQQQGKF